ncbi:MAG TPA: enoyl-CoA hydratase/isomerase family protein [Gemmataceae bacterium]|nr:enoyl-CoA hydratase/isomerase family protein [Gemmataceae bacterium]
MLFASAHVRVTAEYGVGTLWLNFPGEPVNALNLARLRELDEALGASEAHPGLGIVVVRSAKPAGFCAGLHPAALDNLRNAAAFAWYGQTVFNRLAALSAVTVAFIDGPCLGAGLELALACDHRLVLSKPTTHLGFPDTALRPCFGGTTRLNRRARLLLTSGRTLSGREAKLLGLVDHAFCERRGKIELRTFLDDLERAPGRKRAAVAEIGLAAERRAFARAVANGVRVSPWVAPEMPVEIAEARGFITPLEAQQARPRTPVIPAAHLPAARAA